MSVKVRFACGHASELGQRSTPVCPACGETQVTRTFARAPRFVGTCTGPYAESKGLEPGIVDVTTAGPLKLKAQE